VHRISEVLSHAFGDAVDTVVETVCEAHLVEAASIVLSESPQAVRWEHLKGRIDLSLFTPLRQAASDGPLSDWRGIRVPEERGQCDGCLSPLEGDCKRLRGHGPFFLLNVP
jgi:hypothetical protein